MMPNEPAGVAFGVSEDAGDADPIFRKFIDGPEIEHGKGRQTHNENGVLIAICLALRRGPNMLCIRRWNMPQSHANPCTDEQTDRQQALEDRD